MLEEVEEFVTQVVFGTGDINNKLTRILNNWSNRLQATQVKQIDNIFHSLWGFSIGKQLLTTELQVY